jgi:crossover junction endodeoxyribonuclease RusA
MADVDGRFPKPLEWRIDLPYTRPPLSLNDSPTTSMGARHGRRELIKKGRADVGWQAIAAGIPALARFSATLHYRPARNAHRDALNLTATLKPLVDGLVDVGVCTDDDPAHYVGTEPMIHPAVKGEPGGLWLIVQDHGPLTNQGET